MVSEGSRPQTRERPPTRERAEAALADALAEAEAAGLVGAKSEEEAAAEAAAAAAEAVEAEAEAAAATNEAAAAEEAAAEAELEAEAEEEVEAEVETAAVAAEKTEKAARRAMDGHVLLDEDLMRLRRAVRSSRPLRISPTFNPRPWTSEAGDGASPGSPGPRIGLAEAEEAEGAFGAARATLRRASAGNAAGSARLAHSRAEGAQALEGAWSGRSGDWEVSNQDALALAAAAEAAAAEAAAAEAAAAEAAAAEAAAAEARVGAEEAARPATATRPLTSTSSRPATATGVGRCDEAQSRDASRGPAGGGGGVFGVFAPIFPAARSPGGGDWPAAGPAASRAFPKVASGQRRPLSSRARAGRADGASLTPTRSAAEGAVGLMGGSPQFAVDYQPKLSSTSPKQQRRGRASVSPLFGAAGPAAHEFSACGTAVVIAGRGSPAAGTPAGGDAPPAAPALDGSGGPL